MCYKDSASPNNTVNGSESTFAFTVGDFPAQNPLRPVLETSPTDVLNTCKAAFNQSFSLQESSVLSDPNARLLVAIFSLHKMDQFDSSEHIEQNTFTCMSFTSKSTALHSCSASVIICAPDIQLPVDPVPVVPINNDTESDVDKLYEAEAKHVMEEDKRLLFVGAGNEDRGFIHSSEANRSCLTDGQDVGLCD